MSVLGPIQTGDMHLDSVLTLIDERLTELYSIQGKQVGRNNPSFDAVDIRGNAQTGETPTANRIYSNSLCKAWASTGTTGTQQASFNLSAPTFDGLNQYVYTFLRPMADADYAVLVTVSQANSATTTQCATIAGKTQYGFTVVMFILQDDTIAGPLPETANIIGNFQAEHYVAVFGNT